MRFIVYGAGAVGGVLGARLALAGHDVELIARGAHREAIRERGLRLESPDGVETVALPVAGHPEEVAWSGDEVVLLAVKSQDTAAALDALSLSAGAATPVACLQNGVANERLALRHFADVYAVCVMCPAEHLEPGVVVAQCSPVVGLLDLGRYPTGVDDRAGTIAAAFESAGYQSVVREDAMRWKHTKLLMNLGNIVHALCAPGSGRKALIERAREEGRAVLAAAGIPYTSEAEDAERRGDLLQLHEVRGRPRGGSSTWQSLARGTGSLETDYLNGEIVLLGRLCDVPTPANELLQDVGRRAVANGLSPESLGADELLAQLAAGEQRV